MACKGKSVCRRTDLASAVGSGYFSNKYLSIKTLTGGSTRPGSPGLSRRTQLSYCDPPPARRDDCCVCYCSTITLCKLPASFPASSGPLQRRDAPCGAGRSTSDGSACAPHPVTTQGDGLNRGRAGSRVPVLYHLITLLMGPAKLDRMSQDNSLLLHSELFSCSASRERTRV